MSIFNKLYNILFENENTDLYLIVKRVIASVIDIVVLIAINIIFLILILALSKLVFRTEDIKQVISSVHPDQGMLVLSIVSCIFSAVYYIHFECLKNQATPGKKLLKLKVTNNIGKKILLKAAILRFFLYFTCTGLLSLISQVYTPLATQFSGLLFILWLLWMLPILFSKENTTLYDILSKTRVVHQK